MELSTDGAHRLIAATDAGLLVVRPAADGAARIAPHGYFGIPYRQRRRVSLCARQLRFAPGQFDAINRGSAEAHFLHLTAA